MLNVTYMYCGCLVTKSVIIILVMKGLTITGSTLRSRSAEYKSSLTRAFVRDCLHKFEEGISMRFPQINLNQSIKEE